MPAHPLSICYAITSLGKGGAEKQLVLLLDNLDRHRYSPWVIAFQDGSWHAFLRQHGIPVQIVTSRSRLGRVLRLIAIFVKLRPAVVHCYGAGAGFLARPAAIVARVPRIIASERYAVERKSASKQFLERCLAYFTDFVVCNAQHSATFYEENGIVPPRKLKVIRNGIESLAEWRNESPRNPTLGYLANLRDGKNHEFLIHAFHAIKAQVPEAKLLLAGDGARRSFIENLVRSLRLDSDVTFLGSVDNADELFRQISIYCHVSLFEGTPNAIMEAMIRGIPCIASDIPGNRELITNQVNGFLVSPNSINELSSRVVELLNNPSQAKLLGAAGKQFVEEAFSTKRMVEQTTALYA